jgi:hypothetical protein
MRPTTSGSRAERAARSCARSMRRNVDAARHQDELDSRCGVLHGRSARLGGRRLRHAARDVGWWRHVEPGPARHRQPHGLGGPARPVHLGRRLDATAFAAATAAPRSRRSTCSSMRARICVSSRCVPRLAVDAGGGGFIRATTDGGTTWAFPAAPPARRGIRSVEQRLGIYACSSKHRALLASNDLGATWHLPAAPRCRARGHAAEVRIRRSARGSAFALNPVYKSTIYCGLGTGVVRSRTTAIRGRPPRRSPVATPSATRSSCRPRTATTWVAALSGRA